MALRQIISELIYKLTADDAELTKSLKKAEKQADATAKKFTDAGKALTLGVTLPIIAAGAAAVKAVGDFQLYQASFETLLGSVDKAKTLLGDLQTLAASTPFQFDDLAQASKTLLQFGVSLDDVLPTVRQIGDIAQGDADRFKSLSLAFGQVSSTGRLMGQDLLQMINAGFNPLTIIAEKTGKTMAELKDEMAAGAISAEQVADAFATATAEGGPFFEGMEKASKTLPGLISTLKDNITLMARAFAEFLVPAVTAAVQKLTEIAQKFAALPDDTKKTILALLATAAAIGPILIGVGKMIQIINTAKAAFAALGAAGGPVFLAVAAIGALVAGVALLVRHQQKLKEQKIEEEYKGIAEAVGLTSKEIRKLGDDFRILNADEAASTADILEIAKQHAEQTGKTVDEVLILAAAYDGVNDRVKELIKQTQDQLHLERVNAELADSANESVRLRQEAHQKILDNLAAERAEQERIAEIERQQALKEQEFAALLQRIDALVAAGAINEEEALNRKIDIRKTEIDKIKEAAELGKISAQEAARQIAVQQASIDRYAARLSIITEGVTTETIDSYNAVNDAAEASRLVRLGVEQAILDAKEENAKREQELLEASKARTQEWLELGVSPLLQGFQDVGQALVDGESGWRALGKAALKSLSAIVKALGDELAAYAVRGIVQAIFGDPRGIGASVAAAAGAGAAYTAAGAIDAKAATFAQGGSFTIPDGFQNDSFPLAFGQSGERVTVETPAQAATNDLGSVNLHIGTLVADDAGLRELEKRMYKVSRVNRLARGTG